MPVVIVIGVLSVPATVVWFKCVMCPANAAVRAGHYNSLAGISQRHFASDEQERMIVIWVGCKAFLDGDRLDRFGDAVELAAFGNFVAGVIAIEPAA